MIGLPTETEKDIYDTIKLNRLLNPPSIAVTYFTPFMGTELYDTCIKEGFYEPFKKMYTEYPHLKCPSYPKKGLFHWLKSFLKISVVPTRLQVMYKETFITNGHTFILKSDREPTNSQLWSWWESIYELVSCQQLKTTLIP